MKYDVERAVVRLSVTELCSLVLRSGDLDLRYGSSKTLSERPAINPEVYRRLRAETEFVYDAEVPLCFTLLYNGLHYEISGLADGIIRSEPPTVDQIKPVNGRAFELPPGPLYEAQLKCYAFALCCARQCEMVSTRLTYYRVGDGTLKHLTATHQAEELREFCLFLLSRIAFRAEIAAERETVRVPSAANCHFPYSSLREGQEIMLKECYRDIRAGRRLFLQAPTGIGKTISALYPAMRALGEGHCDKIFYLTAKEPARREAYRAASRLFSAGAHLRTLVLTAKEQLCRNDAAKCDALGVSAHCNPADCPYAKGFYDRCPTAVCDALSAQSGFGRASVAELAEKHHICPYEFQLELSEFCDVLICDYNYVFDPRVYLRRYFSSRAQEGERFVFLIDEAHNLADRAAEMYSASFCSSTLDTLLTEFPKAEEKARRSIEQLAAVMHGMRRLCKDTLYKDDAGVEHGYYVGSRSIEAFHKQIRETDKQLDGWLRTHRGDAFEVPVAVLQQHLKQFSAVAEYDGDGFMTFIEVEGERCTYRLRCLDPSHILHACMERAKATVLFSATLTPMDYFSDILGGGKHAVRLSLPSPYDAERLFLCAVTGISTRFEERERSYRKIAGVIAATASGKAGNYIVYFPSYEYLERVLEVFCKKYEQVPVIVQKKGMTAKEREAFLNAFQDDGTLRIGFCVLGGAFSEGVNLPGGCLIGTVIVGPGLPGLSNERNLLRDYYENTRERGYDYAYTYPGINRVFQAAGRVIRGEEDCGVVVLVDSRYAEPKYRTLFPEHWSHIQYARNSSELAKNVEDFWLKFKNK